VMMWALVGLAAARGTVVRTSAAKHKSQAILREAKKTRRRKRTRQTRAETGVPESGKA